MNSTLDFQPIPNPAQHSIHLTEDEIDDHLIGDLAAAPAAHLDACALCTHRVSQARDPITSFQSLTIAWSERRSATLPIPNRSMNRPLWQRRAAWVTTCSALAIGIAFANVGHRSSLTANVRPAQIQASPQVPASTDTSSIAAAAPARQISADNKMLQAIDDEIHTTPNSPSALGLDPVSDHSNWSPAAPSLQD